MPRLKDRNKQTPGGHQFYDPVLKYRARPWASIDEIASGLIQARLANPSLTQQHGWSTDETTVRNEVDAAIARHCQQMGWNNFVVADGGPPVSAPFPQQRPQTQRFLGKLRNAAVSGSPVIVDFIKSKEEAVPLSLAIKRADTCLSCEFNQKTQSLLDVFTVTASEAIRKSLEIARGWNLTTPNSEGLGVCTQCSCPLRLKIFIPITKIHARLSNEIRDQLPSWCWIKKESNI